MNELPPPPPAPVPGRALSPGWALALGAALLLCVAQAAALPALFARRAWALQHQAETNGAVDQRMAVRQGEFHLAGTVLLVLGVIGLYALQPAGAPAHAARQHLRRALLFPLASALVWLAWATARFGDSDVVLWGSLIPGVAGLGVPGWSAVGLFRLARQDPGNRRLRWLSWLAAAIWAWSVAFALTELVISFDA